MVDRRAELRPLMGGDYQVLYSSIMPQEERESPGFRHKTVSIIMPAPGASGLNPYTVGEIATRHSLVKEAANTRAAEAMRSMTVNIDGPYNREQQLTATLAFWDGPESKPSLMPASIAPSAETSNVLVIDNDFGQALATLSAHRQNLIKNNERNASASATTLALLGQFGIPVDKQGFERASNVQSNTTLGQVIATEDLIDQVIAISAKKDQLMYDFVGSHAVNTSTKARLCGKLSSYDTAGLITQPEKRIAITRGGPNHITVASAMSSLPDRIKTECDLDKLVDVVATEQQLTAVANIECPTPGAFMTNNQTVTYDVVLAANLNDIQEVPFRFPEVFPKTLALMNWLGIRNGRR